MIITHPPDAKLPEHLHSYPTLPQLPTDTSVSDDHHFPPTRSAPSIADTNDLPPAYADSSQEPLVPNAPRRRIRNKKRLRLMAGGILFVYVALTTTLLILFWVCSLQFYVVWRVTDSSISFQTGHLVRKHPVVRTSGPGIFNAPIMLPPGYRPAGAPEADVSGPWYLRPSD